MVNCEWKRSKDWNSSFTKSTYLLYIWIFYIYYFNWYFEIIIVLKYYWVLLFYDISRFVIFITIKSNTNDSHLADHTIQSTFTISMQSMYQTIAYIIVMVYTNIYGVK